MEKWPRLLGRERVKRARPNEGLGPAPTLLGSEAESRLWQECEGSCHLGLPLPLWVEAAERGAGVREVQQAPRPDSTGPHPPTLSLQAGNDTTPRALLDPMVASSLRPRHCLLLSAAPPHLLFFGLFSKPEFKFNSCPRLQDWAPIGPRTSPH